MSIVSCNHMAAITSQWWRRQVNVYDVKAGMVCLQCKNCVIHTWALQMWVSHDGALCKFICTFSKDIYIWRRKTNNSHRAPCAVLCVLRNLLLIVFSLRVLLLQLPYGRRNLTSRSCFLAGVKKTVCGALHGPYCKKGGKAQAYTNPLSLI